MRKTRCLTFFASLLSIGVMLGKPLVVSSDFEGGSIKVIEIDSERRTVSVMPGGDPRRGWPCWWYFRIDGVTPGETLTVHLHGSKAAVGEKGKPMQNPLSSS